MIYEIYKTVITIANKEHFGEITPLRFGYLANNAQLRIFSDLIIEQRRAKGKNFNELSRQSLRGALENLLVLNYPLKKTGANSYFLLPSDFALEESLFYRGSIPITKNITGLLGLVQRSKFHRLSKDNPFYEKEGLKIHVYPESVGAKMGNYYPDDVTMNYYRYPLSPSLQTDPATGYVSAVQTNDFELPLMFFNKLVVNILEQIGITLREEAVAQYANAEQSGNFQTDNL